MKQSAELKYEDIKVGTMYEFEKIITQAEIMKFAELSGDYNPLHADAEFGSRSQFGQNIAHGMLGASFFSTLVGMYCPGKNSLYLSQTLQFKKPLFNNDLIIVRGIVMDKQDSVKMITLKTEILRNGEVMISGEAKVKVLE